MHIEQSLADGIKELETLLLEKKIVRSPLYDELVQHFLEAKIPPEFLIKEFTTPQGTRSDGTSEFPILRVDAKFFLINLALYRMNLKIEREEELVKIIRYFLALIVYVEIGFTSYGMYAQNTYATSFETHKTRNKDDVLKEGLPKYNVMRIIVQNLFRENVDIFEKTLPEWAKNLDFFKELMAPTNK
jgi:hypothetical protein